MTSIVAALICITPNGIKIPFSCTFASICCLIRVGSTDILLSTDLQGNQEC